MSVVGKMVMCKIMGGDGATQVIYGEWDDIKKGGVYSRLETLAEVYIICCLMVFPHSNNELERAEFITYIHETLWHHISGKLPMTDIRAKFPIVADIQREWDKLSEEERWEFLD